MSRRAGHSRAKTSILSHWAAALRHRTNGTRSAAAHGGPKYARTNAAVGSLKSKYIYNPYLLLRFYTWWYLNSSQSLRVGYALLNLMKNYKDSRNHMYIRTTMRKRESGHSFTLLTLQVDGTKKVVAGASSATRWWQFFTIVSLDSLWHMNMNNFLQNRINDTIKNSHNFSMNDEDMNSRPRSSSLTQLKHYNEMFLH